MTTSSTGGSITNVNIWPQKISIEAMNMMLWEGTLFDLEASQMDFLGNGINGLSVTFNVSG